MRAWRLVLKRCRLEVRPAAAAFGQKALARLVQGGFILISSSGAAIFNHLLHCHGVIQQEEGIKVAEGLGRPQTQSDNPVSMELPSDSLHALRRNIGLL